MRASIPVRRARRALVSAGLLLASLAACERPVRMPPPPASAGHSPTPSASISVAPSVHDTPVRPLSTSATRALDPGRYARGDFTPALSFEVTETWFAVQAVPGFFDIQRGAGTLDVIAVQFARPVGSATVGDLVSTLRARSDLVVSEPTSVRLGGRSGTRIVVETADPDIEAQAFVAVLRVPAGPISIASGRRLQVDLLDMDMDAGVLAVLVGGSVRAWEAAQSAAAPVLASIRFDT